MEVGQKWNGRLGRNGWLDRKSKKIKNKNVQLSENLKIYIYIFFYRIQIFLKGANCKYDSEIKTI